MNGTVKVLQDQQGNNILPVTAGNAVQLSDGTTAESSLKAVDYGGGAVIPTQEAWQIPTLSSGWVSYGTGDELGFYKDSVGIVHLKGLIKNGTIAWNAVIFTFPIGYRPSRTLYLTTSTSTGYSRITIASTGNVCMEAGSATMTSFDGITFRAEQ